MAEKEGLIRAVLALTPSGRLRVQNGDPAVLSNPLVGFKSLLGEGLS